MGIHNLPHLHTGDRVAVIAPASRAAGEVLSRLLALLQSWDLQVDILEPIFGDDLLCAHTDEMRFLHLKEALLRSDIDGIVCVRGGYGSMRLLPALSAIELPVAPKVFLGMSDITALHLFLNQHWGWPTYHASLASGILTPESVSAVQSLMFGNTEKLVYPLIAMNAAAEQNACLESSLIGGNLTLIQTSMGTGWQMNAKNKIIFIEEIGERGYRIDRMLEQLRQAGLFLEAAAILFGDCLEGEEPNGTSLIDPVLFRFAEQSPIPVLRIHGVGHGSINYPLPLGTKTALHLGHNCQLIFC